MKRHLTVDKTSLSCPEQYDVYYKDEVVGYLRLRHGVFKVEFVDKRGRFEEIYTAYPKGDGMFLEEEREEHIKKALEELDKYMTKVKYKKMPGVLRKNAVIRTKTYKDVPLLFRLCLPFLKKEKVYAYGVLISGRYYNDELFVVTKILE